MDSRDARGRNRFVSLLANKSLVFRKNKLEMLCQLSPFNLSQIFNNDCFNGFNQQHLFSIASDRVNTTLASPCSIDNFKRVAFSEREIIPCLAVDPNKPIPVGYKYWWLPRIDKFFLMFFIMILMMKILTVGTVGTI